jgi:hypothetical protein
MMDSVQSLLLDLVQRRLKELDLNGIADEAIVQRRLPRPDGVALPCVIISPMPERFNPQGGTNEKDDVTFGVLISIIKSNNRNLASENSDFRDEMYWREKVRRGLSRWRSPEVGDACWRDSVVESGEPLIPELWRNNYAGQYLVLRVLMREPRT